MPSLILSPRYSSDTQALWKACITEPDWDTYRAHRFQVDPDIKDPTVFGEMQFCDIIASRIGLHLLEPPLDFLQKLYQHNSFFTHREVKLVRHRDLAAMPQRAFYKPANDKVFVAGIYESGMDVPRKYIDPDCPVIVSGVIEFEYEYRCYVLDRQVQTLSCYDWVGMTHLAQPEESEAAQAFAQRVLDSYPHPLPSAFVLDVGYTPSGWAVIEANQAYASGIYHEADVHKVLPVIYRSACKTVSPEDKAFERYFP